MSTDVWPPISPEELQKEEAISLANELQWLLQSLQTTLQSLKAGLEECAALLEPTEPGSTLVMSSHRSESVKGVLTRVGTRVVKGNIQLRLQTLPPPTRGAPAYPLTLSSAPHAPSLILHEVVAVRTLINSCLDIVDASMWTGDARDAGFIAGQLRLLEDNVAEAKAALKGAGPEVQQQQGQRGWWEDPLDDRIFDPPLPSNVSFHLSIVDAALVLTLRTLSPAPARPGTAKSHQAPASAFSFRDQLAMALGGGPRAPQHDEADEVFSYRGEDVVVREKVRVESQDPSLMSAMAKLGSLERVVRMGRQALAIVMGRDGVGDEDSDD